MKKIFALVCILISSSVYAKDIDVEVCRLQINDNGKAYLSPCGTWNSENNCPQGGWVTWNAETEAGKMMYSTALSAFVSEKKVKLRFDGARCDGYYDITSMIRIQK